VLNLVAHTERGTRLRVFENSVLWRIFGPKRDEVAGQWRKVYEKFNDLYSPPNNVQVIKSRRMRWAGQVGFWWGNLRERDHLRDPGVDGRIILRWIFRKWDGAMIGFIWLRTGTGDGHL